MFTPRCRSALLGSLLSFNAKMAVFLPVFLLPACGSVVRDDAIELILANAPATLDPRYATDAAGMRVTRLLHAGLVRLDPATLKPTPYLAESLTWVSPLELEVKLRDNIQFASGAPFQSYDVCATLEAIQSNTVQSPHRIVVASIKQCEPTGPLSLKIILKEPRATLQTDLEIPVLRRDQAAGPPLPDGRLDGLGPYIVKENTAQGIVLAGRSNAALPRPNHNLSIRYVHDENARAVRLLAGRSDIVPNGVSPSLVSTLEKQGAIANSRPGANLTYLLIHNQRPPFDNPEVRKAAAMAIDRGLLVNTLFGGHAKVANTFWPLEQIPDGVKNEILAQTLPLFDPNAARQIVDKLPNKTINLLTSTERSRALQGRIMAQMLRDVGFEVNVSTLDLGAMLHRLSKGDFELALLQMPELTEPNVLRWFFHSDSIPGQGRAGANRARFSDSTVDSLFDRAAVLTDIEERWALYSRALRRMNEQLPVIPLFHEDQIALVSQRAAGFSLSAEGRWLDVAFLP